MVMRTTKGDDGEIQKGEAESVMRLAWNGEVGSTDLLSGARGTRDDEVGGTAGFLRNSIEDAGNRVTEGWRRHGWHQFFYRENEKSNGFRGLWCSAWTTSVVFIDLGEETKTGEEEKDKGMKVILNCFSPQNNK